jgi:Pectate lyase superfamily protein
MKILTSAPNYCIDVKKFGAKGDGATDDRAAITLAVTSAVALGLPLRFGPGTYVISKYIDFADIYNGIRIYGDGGPIIRYPSNDTSRTSDGADGPAKDNIAAKAGFIFRRCQNVVLEGLTFWGSALFGTPGDVSNLTSINVGAAIKPYNCQGMRVRNCADLVGGGAFFTQDDQSDTAGTGDSLATVGTTVTLTDAAHLFRAGMTGRYITISGATHPAHNGTFRVVSVPSSPSSGGFPTTLTYVNPAASAAIDETASFTWSVNDADQDTIVENCIIRSRSYNCTGSYGTFRNCYVDRPGIPDLVGSGDRFDFEPTTGVVTLTDNAGNFRPYHNGKQIKVQGASSAGNNTGTNAAWTVTYISSTQISYVNASGVTEIFAKPPATSSRTCLYWIIGGEKTGIGAGAAALTRVSAAGTGDSIAINTPSSGISTLTDSAGSFTSDMIGMPLKLSGTVGSKNNGTAAILTVSGGGTIVTYAQPSTAANETSAFTWTVEYTCLTAATASFTADDDYKQLRVKNATSAANNGAWIARYKSSTQLNFQNIAGVTETYSGMWALDGYNSWKDVDNNTHGSSHAFYVFGSRRGCTFENNQLRNVRTTCFKASGSGTSGLRDIMVRGNYARDCSAFAVMGADDATPHTGFMIVDNLIRDNSTGCQGWNDGGSISFLGSRNVTIANNQWRWTRNATNAVDGVGVGLVTVVSASRYVAGQSQPLEDLTIIGNKMSGDSFATTGPSLFNTAISVNGCGLLSKYATAGVVANITATFTAAVTDICTQSAHGYRTGDGPFQLTTTGTLPSPLTVATDYYIIFVSSSTFKLATSFANAVAGTAVDITTTGTGVQTIKSPNVKFTDSTNGLFSQEEVNKQIVLTGYSGGNDGTYTIASVDSGGTFLTYRNTTGAAGSGGTYRINRLVADGGGGSMCQIRNNEIRDIASNGITTSNCINPAISGNIFSNLLNNIVSDGDATPMIYNNSQVGAATTNGQIQLGNGATSTAQAYPSWPCVWDNFTSPQSLGISTGARGFGVGVNGSQTYVDHPLLGKSGKVQPTGALEEVVFPYGSLPVDGDTLTLGGTTITYKKSAPGASQFNTFNNDAGGNRSILTAIATDCGGGGVYTATDYGAAYHDSTGASFDVITGHIRVRKVAQTTGNDGTFSAASNTLNPTFLPILFNTNANTSCKSKGAGSTGPVADKLVIWSPLAKYEAGTVNLVADNTAARQLLAGDRKATGTITCTTKANYVDTDFMTIGDGINVAKVYEFDTAGDGVTAGRIQVNISASTTAADVATVLATAITANQPAITVSRNTGVLTLTHNFSGPGTNITITENVANAGHTVSGFTGGTTGGYRRIVNSQAVATHDEVDSGANVVVQTGTSLGTEEFRWTL